MNFEKSVFDTIREEQADNKIYTINSYEEYISLTIKHQRGVIPKKIVFNSMFDQSLDVFGTRFLGGRKYISARLKEKLEKHKIKGYSLRIPIDPKVDILLEWE